MDDQAVVRIVRSVGSVVAGLAAATLTVVIMTWIVVQLMLDGDMAAAPTTAYLGVNLAYSLFAAVLGGWLAARIAAHKPVLHAGVVGAVMLLLALAGDADPPQGGVPGWYNPAVGVIGAVGALIGGFLHRGQLEGPGAGAAAP